MVHHILSVKGNSEDSYMDSNSKIFVNSIGVRMGRPSLVSQNLEFVAPVKEFVAQHSAAAHNRHRQDTEYCH